MICIENIIFVRDKCDSVTYRVRMSLVTFGISLKISHSLLLFLFFLLLVLLLLLLLLLFLLLLVLLYYYYYHFYYNYNFYCYQYNFISLLFISHYLYRMNLPHELPGFQKYPMSQVQVLFIQTALVSKHLLIPDRHGAPNIPWGSKSIHNEH